MSFDALARVPMDSGDLTSSILPLALRGRFDAVAPDLLAQVVSRRYEKRSLVLTTNLAFADWNTIFPNEACATALIERLVHHSDIITIDGESYRLREAEKDALARRT